MPYTPYVWQNFPNVTTPISKANLDHLETQYDEAVADILTVAETEVYNGNSPAAWTDLDISAVVGTNPALVLLKIYYPAGAQESFAFRKNGDGDEFYSGSYDSAGAAAGSTVAANIFYAVMVATDVLGVIEWKTDGVVAATTVDVIAFVITS